MDVTASVSPAEQALPPRRLKLRRIGLRCFQGACFTTILLAVAAVVLWRYAAGNLPVDWVRARLVGVVEQATGGRANVALKSASIRSTDDGPRLVLDGFALHDANGRTMVGAPRAEIAFDLWTLIFGGVAMRRIELHDVEVRLALDRDGRIALSSTHSSGETTTAASDWRGLVGSVAAILAGKDSSAVAGLDRFALRNGRLVIDDLKNGGQIRYDDIAIDLDTTNVGRRLSVAARGGARAWSIVAQRDPSTADLFAIDLTGVPIADAGAIMRLPIESRDGGGALNGRLSVKTSPTGDPETLAANLATKGGQLVIAPGTKSEAVVTGLGLDAAWDASARVITVSKAELRTPAAVIEIAGSVTTHMNGDWEIEVGSGKGSARSIRPGSAPIAIDRMEARAAWLGDGALNVPSWIVAGKDYEFRGEARMAAPGDGGSAQARLIASPMDIITALSLWPAGVAEDARIYTTRTVQKGRLDRLDVRLQLDAAARAALLEGKLPPREALSVDVAASQARYVPLDELPPIDIDLAQGKIDAREVVITAPTATMETPAKTRVTISDAKFVSDYTNGVGPSRVDLRIKGGADASFDLLETPLLKKVVDVGDEIDLTKGSADIRVVLGFPINVPIKVSDVTTSVAGSLSGVTIDGAVPNEPLTDVRAFIAFDRGEFAMKGEGKLSGATTAIEVKRASNGLGEAALLIQMDEAARAKKGLPSGAALAGPTPVRITRGIGPVKAPARVEIDLTRATINNFVPGWVKPVGRPGKITFAYAQAAKSSDFELQDFQAESAGFLLKGTVTLGPNNILRAAKFLQARMSPGDDAQVNWERTGANVKVTVRGSNIDARPILKAIYEPPRDGPAETGEFDLDLKSSILTGHNGEAATNVEMRVMKRGSDLRQFIMSGRFGKSEVRGQLARRSEGQPRMLIESADAGAFFRFIDLYRRMVGGQLTIDIGVNDTRQEGQIVVNDFVLRNEPALRQVSAPAPANAEVADTGGISRSRRVETPRGDVDFEKVRVDFVRSSGRLDIKDGVMWGPVLGVQFEGIVDGPRDRVDVTGTYVPAYALNNAFAQVPVVGLILGGGQYGGLFGVNFKVSGAFSQPSVTVNPLSALTPGVFRRFLEFNKQSIEGRTPTPQRDLGAARP